MFMNEDAVNLEFVHNNTINLQDKVFNSSGRKIYNFVDDVLDTVLVNLRQLNDLKRCTKRGELYKVTKVISTRILYLLDAIHK